jgi:hypothetical protein
VDGLDILVVADPRFSGGTSAALAADVHAFSALGLRVGLLWVASGFLDGTPERPNRAVMGLADLPGVEIVRTGGTVRAELAFLHHPLAFFHGVRAEAGERVRIDAARAVIVAHHPPFRGDGSLEYDPLITALRVRTAFGCRPWWAPISGVVRAQLRSFSPLLVMTTEDWSNVFDPAAWRPGRAAFAMRGAGDAGGEDGPVVGRHGRPDPLKWPAEAGAATAPLAPGPGWRTRVMGCPETELRAMGADLSGWEVLPFGVLPARDFLDGIDVFSFFYHPRWVEAFGRTVAEAILMERPCVLDPRLKPTFGDLADCCRPEEAPACLGRLRDDPAAARALASERRDRAVRRFGAEGVALRLAALRTDRGTRSRLGPKAASAPVALRKLAGLTRRRLAAGRA